jgi:ATP-dependent helicase/nuclease subunit B
VPLETVLLLVPSAAAASEWPRRVAATGRALAGLQPFKLIDLARAIAQPLLLGRGLRPWDTGHDALVAGRLLAGPHELPLAADTPTGPTATALARTLAALRRAGFSPEALERAAPGAALGAGDTRRLRALAGLYRRYHETLEGRFADPATLLRSACEHLADTPWLRGASALVVGEPELDPLEQQLLAALARVIPVRVLTASSPPGLAAGAFSTWARAHALTPVPATDTLLATAAPSALPASLERLRTRLFEPPAGEAVRDDGVRLVTAPGEAAEVRSVARQLLREAARGVPFEEMGVVLPHPETYAPLFTDLFERLQIPHKLHPSLPLRFGRAARSLLLLFRCRGLERAAVMEFLTFAPVPFAEILGAEVVPRPAQWDAISRDAGIVSGLERWIIGIRSYAEKEREAARGEASPERGERRAARAADAEALLRIVELLYATLERLSGEASWSDWSERLREAVAQWIGPERDTEAVSDVVADLAGLAALEARVPWPTLERVVEARLDWERLPLEPVGRGAVHVGALDAMAGLPFRVLAIVGLVEGGFPGILRPDPFLLDPERRALRGAPLSATAPAAKKAPAVPRQRASRQLTLFEDEEMPLGPEPAGVALEAAALALPTTQERLLEQRRRFHRAVSQASERLLLSYPRADARSGRERMPSLFFVAAASALEGRPVSGAELDRLVSEDETASLPAEECLDRVERDRARVLAGGREAALAIAAGSRFFRQSRLASEARWSGEMTPYDGLVAFAPRDGVEAERARAVRERLDPLAGNFPVSASRLASFSRCGFQYLLQYVLRLEAALEPEERKRLEPLERGSLFHEVAERFLRQRRDSGQLPLQDDAATRDALLRQGDEALDELVSGSPPRFTLLWERERRRFRETLARWLERELASGERAQPAHFEVGFGLGGAPTAAEPHLPEPLEVPLGDGRTLRVSGKIDRIDRKPDGSLLVRDYKTGRAPSDKGGVFRGGKQLQIPFYILAAERIFAGTPVSEAFLDYVDGGRRLALDPAVVRSDGFRALLRGLIDAIAAGVFLQEPSSCDWCDFTAVCGPAPLIAQRRRYKLGDARVQAVLRLRDL